MRRQDREQPREFALDVLDTCDWAALATITPKGKPYVIPISMVREGEHLYFHCAKKGDKTDNMRHCKYVSLTCTRRADTLAEAFSVSYESAVVQGKVSEILDDAEKRKALRLLSEKYVPDHMHLFEREMKKGFRGAAVWKIDIMEISGKKNE